MAAPLSPPRLLPSGDSAITVEFSRNIDDAANQRVLARDTDMTPPSNLAPSWSSVARRGVKRASTRITDQT